jgi:hypothetical protein
MDLITTTDFDELIQPQEGLCVSIFMPTNRTAAETQKDMIRFKNLLSQAQETMVGMKSRYAAAQAFLDPMQGLLQDHAFWKQQREGLAVFLSTRAFRYYRLPITFEELVVVSDRFHIKPLLRLLAGDGHFYVLAISQNEVRLLRCTRYLVNEVDLKDVPGSLAAALRHEDREKQLQFHTGTSSRTGQRPAVFHGHGVGIDDTKDDILRFFRRVDRGLKSILRGEKAPLVLAGVDYLFPIYRQANTYGNLLSQGIAGNPESVSAEQLHRKAWNMVQPYFQEGMATALARYKELSGAERGSNDLRQIVPAAYYGKVEVLFVALGIQQWGAFDSQNSLVQVRQEPERGDQDLLDFAAIETLNKRGTVYAVEPDEVPGEGIVAALFRY